MLSEALKFVTEKLLRSIDVQLSIPDMLDASEMKDESLNAMKNALYQFVAYIIFANKQDARNFVKRQDLNSTIDALRLIGFDPFLFDLDNNPQHILLSLGWLIWRVDLFKIAYDPLRPEEDLKYLPPYGEYLTDPTVDEPREPKQPPENHDKLTKRIQRLYFKITTQLHELSDLEMGRETFNWQIRSIDPESSLYALSLKANVPLLTAHSDALRRAISNSHKIQQIFALEKTFWEWLSNIAERPHIDPSHFDEMRALPVDWWPDLVSAPFATHNKDIDELQRLYNIARKKMQELKFSCGDLRRDSTKINQRQADIITREIDDKFESLLRFEAQPEHTVTERKAARLIPQMAFKDYSDSELQRIIDTSQDRCDEVAANSCQKIADAARAICEEMGFEMHGWEVEKFARKRILDDDLDIERPAEKHKLRAPKMQKKPLQPRAPLPARQAKNLPPEEVPREARAGSRSRAPLLSNIPKAGTKASAAKKKVARKPRPEWNL